MTDRERDIQSTDDETEESTDARLDRRTVLKGTAAAGLAGSGLAGTASADGFDEITFCDAGDAGDEKFSFFFEVSGEVKRGGTYESDEFDEVGDDFAEGAVDEGRCDSFLFSGEIKELRLDGPGTVAINGEIVEDTTEEELPNTITIEAEGEEANYKFRVSGQVEKADRADGGDDIDGNVVRGTVVDGNVDEFRFSGALCFDKATGPVTVTLDVNPD